MILGQRENVATPARETITRDWPLVSVIIAEGSGSDAAVGLLESLSACTYPSLEIVLLASPQVEPESTAWPVPRPRIARVPAERLRGAGSGINAAIAHASGELLLFLDGAALVEPDFLEPMVLLLRGDPCVGIVSPKVVSADAPEVIQYAGLRAGRFGFSRPLTVGKRERDAGQYDHVRDTDLPHQACLLVRRDLFGAGQLGPLPHNTSPSRGWRELARRARRIGYKVMFCGHSTVAHTQGPELRLGVAPGAYPLLLAGLGYCRRLVRGMALPIDSVRSVRGGLRRVCTRLARRSRWQRLRAAGRAPRWSPSHAVEF